MRGLTELVFSVTNRCTARCRDCPVVHENMPPYTLTYEEMVSIVNEILPWKTLKLVVFTGGEPFMLGKSLEDIVAYVSNHNILTRSVTNAYWTTSKKRAIKTLSRFKTSDGYFCSTYLLLR